MKHLIIKKIDIVPFGLAILWSVLCLDTVSAQQYTSLTGLIHTPSADMCPVGEARIGAHYLNREMLPTIFGNNKKIGRYDTGSFYISATPFSWLEVGYVFVLMKGKKIDINHPEETGKIGYYHKDRHLSVKIRPIKEKEGEWWPSIAIGSDDPVNSKGTEETGSQYFRNFYGVVTKHFSLGRHRLGAHLAYRKWTRDGNEKWDGVVGGITYQPPFDQNLRLIAEYTGDDVNVGFDWKLWKHVLIQSSLQNGKYFSGGICFYLNLL